jgi:cytochrome c553
MKKTMHIPSTVIAILLGLASTSGQGAGLTQPVSEKERSALFPSTEMLIQGRNVADSTCAECHGMDGVSDSDGKPHLAGQRAVYLYRAQQAYGTGARKDVTKKHNGFLNDEALLSVAAYYASLPTAPAAEVLEVAESGDAPVDDPFLSIRPAMKKCVKCHGESGNAKGSGMPNLTAQNPEYFLTSMLGYVDGSRSHSLMKKLVGSLDEATISELGVYYAVQKPVRSQTQGTGDVNVGRRLAASCEGCHGEGGNNHKAGMPSLAGQDAKYFVKAMNHYKDGKRQHEKMFEAVEALSEQDTIDLATYYAAQEPLQRPGIRTPLKSTEWLARCGRCHGIDGNSSDPRFPMLAGQDKGYLIKTISAYGTGERADTTMHAMAAPPSAMDIERIGTYFSTQPAKAVVYIELPCEHDDQE